MKRTSPASSPARKHLRSALFLVLLLILVPSLVQAAGSSGFRLSKAVLSGGGAPAVSGSTVSMNGSLGQPIAGAAASDKAVLNGGFWSADAVGSYRYIFILVYK